MRVLGYVFVSDVGDLAAGPALIRSWCAERGVAPATVVHDSDPRRPSLAWALEQIDAGRACVLVVSRLRDLCEDVGDLVPLLRWFVAPPRSLVALDLGLDTSSEAGRGAAAALADLVVRAGGGSVAAGWRHSGGGAS